MPKIETFAGGFFDPAYRFVRHAWERRAHKERFIVSGKTPFNLILEDDIMQVRYYPHQDSTSFQLDDQMVEPTGVRHRVPVILVPPLGVFGWIYDLMAERSWVRFLNAQGFEVYLIDWGAPERRHANSLSLEQYVNNWMFKAVRAVRDHSGQNEVSLVGYCMGGLLGLMYTGAHGLDHVRNLVTIASPIDFHASHGYGKLMQFTSKGAKRLPVLGKKIDAGTFHIPGETLSVLFKLTNPLGGVMSYLDLVRNLSDREYLTAHLTTKEWFTNMVDYPGATVQRMVFDMALNNRLASGKVRLGDFVADLTSINSNYLAFAGKTDQIVSVRAARKGQELLASKDKTFMVVPGGHAGVFAGGRAKDHTWVHTAEWLARRSA